MNPVLLCLGGVNADFQVQLPRPFGGETLPAGRFTRLSGGKAANRAFLARRLGAPAALLARVGDEDLREQSLGPLHEAGMDLASVTVAAGCPTAFSVIAVPPDGEKAILLAGNANDAWDEAAERGVAERVAAAPPGSVLAVDCEVAAGVVRRAAQAVRARGFGLVVDPFWPDRVEREVLTGALAVAPNASEAQALAGVEAADPASAAEAARRLLALGPALALVETQDGGCVLAERGGERR